jgi:hypothetical protein
MMGCPILPVFAGAIDVVYDPPASVITSSSFAFMLAVARVHGVPVLVLAAQLVEVVVEDT